MSFFKKLLTLVALSSSLLAQADYGPMYTCPGPYACVISSYLGIQFPDGSHQTTAATGGGASPAMPNGSIQFNNSGAFGGSSNLTWNGSNLNASNFALPNAGTIYFGGSSNPNWNMGLNISPGWSANKVSGNILYLNLSSTTGEGLSIGNSNFGSAFEIDAFAEIWMSNTLGVDTIRNYSGNSGFIDVFDAILSDNNSPSANSLDWSNRVLLFTDGTTRVVDWTNLLLNDSSSITSVDFGNRQLFDNTGNYGIDYGRYFMNDSGGTYSIKWDARFLQDTNGGTSVDYGNRYLLANDSSTINVDFSTPNAVVVKYTVADPTKWAGSPPADLATAVNRIAAVVGAITPIP